MEHEDHEGHEDHEVAPPSKVGEAAGREVVDAAIKVHRVLGPGLLESAYEQCLAHELTARGLRVQRQVALPIVFDGLRIEAGYRLDMVVDEAVIVEVKATRGLAPIDEAQAINYLKVSRLQNLRKSA